MPKPFTREDRDRLERLEKEQMSAQAAKVPQGFVGQMAGRGLNQIDSLEMEISKLRSVVAEQQRELLGLYRRLHGLGEASDNFTVPTGY